MPLALPVQACLLMLIATAASTVAHRLMQQAIHRPRPPFAFLAGKTSPSYPSGHATRSAAAATRAHRFVDALLQSATLLDEAKSMAQETAENLKEPVQQAAQSVKETAQQGVEHVREDGTSAAQDVKESAQGGSATGGSTSNGSTTSTFGALGPAHRVVRWLLLRSDFSATLPAGSV